ncbi:MAG: histidine kinase [Verrucomicrobia bacterium]|nr:histidine kinase [Verrucomicrobiota bacterium]MDA1069221.1 histidine kinase [Verrucomicrobiota bacterium]
MPFKRLLCFAFCFGPGLAASEKDLQSLNESIHQLSLNELEQRRVDIADELSRLAHYSLRSGVGSIGYRSMPHDNPDHAEWVEVKLEKEVLIDEIILIPAIWRDAQNGFVADGFPKEFKIIAGKKGESKGDVVASYSREDPILPRIAPLVVPIRRVEAAWIRLEATHLSPRSYDNRYILQLSEIMIFSGTENVAIRGSTTTSSEQRAGSGAWHKDNLIKGFLPYLLDSAEGESSLAYVSENDIGNTPEITFDLKAVYSIDSIYLHGVEQGDTVPQAFAGDFGVPRWLQIIGATNPDFSDQEILLDIKVENSLDTAPILMLPLQPRTSRFVKFVGRIPYKLQGFGEDGSEISLNRIGFSEIEIFSMGKNLSRGKIPTTNFNEDSPNRSILSLTDGNNLYGKILPLHAWMHQLAKRHELEALQPVVELALTQGYNQQESRLRLLSWAIAALFAGTIIFILITRHLRQRAIFDLRNRIAADLHDELGANLHAVSMLGELASKSKHDPEKMDGLIDRMRALIQRTSKAVKYCTNILETPGLYEDFEDAMKRNADRLLADLDHELVFEASDIIAKMRSSRRIDLVLFYKECLINVIRHSGSTHVETRLTTEDRNLHLQVSDNGRGFPESEKSKVPTSLRRRAKLLDAKVTVTSPESGGAQVHLIMKI